MVDVSLMAKLLEAVPPTARVILVGDTYQLPSVGPGNVLKDIIASGIVPFTELTIIKRQDAGDIIKNCHRIKAGHDIEVSNSTSKDFFFLPSDTEESGRTLILDLVTRRLPATYKADRLREIQVISPLREKTGLSCKFLNFTLQAALCKSPKIEKSKFRIGDKVIQLKNDYERGIINGDIGYISGHDEMNRILVVDFESPDRRVELPLFGNDLDLAYAVTCHKYQGSEARIVVIPISRSFGSLIMQRNWIYTAISRAKEICVLVGHRDEISKTIRRNQQQKRATKLRFLLNETP